MKSPASRFFCLIALLVPPALSASIPTTVVPTIIVDTAAEPVARGKFAPTWASLQQYQVPDWFRNAKFGIWAHWGPQCQPAQGDWYARHMYLEGEAQYKWHATHPATSRRTLTPSSTNSPD